MTTRRFIPGRGAQRRRRSPASGPMPCAGCVRIWAADRRRPRRRGLLGRDPAGLRLRPHHGQPEQRRRAARRPTHVLDQMIRDLRFSNELPVIHMWQTLEPRVESVRRELARELRLRPGGDGDHPERLRGQRDHDLRARPQAGRRGGRHQSELRPDAHRLGPAGPARRHRAQAGLVPAAPALAGVPAGAVHGGGHPPHPGHRGHPHHQPLGPDPAGPGAGRLGPAPRHRGVRRRGARLRPLPLHPRRAGLRLLRHQPAQVAAGADRHRVPLRAEEQADGSSGR